MKGGKPGLNVRRKGAAWKLRMQLSKKQEKTRKSKGRLFLSTMKSLVWSVK